MARGARHWRFSSLRGRRSAARLSRRLWTGTSSTIPVWSNHPGLVHGTPEPVLHPGDPDGHLIRVPLAPGTGQPPPDPVGERLAELERPPPHGLVAHDDAAGGQHLLDHAQAEREAEVQPHRVADDLGREAMTGIGRLGGWWAHSGSLPDRGQPAKPDPS